MGGWREGGREGRRGGGRYWRLREGAGEAQYCRQGDAEGPSAPERLCCVDAVCRVLLPRALGLFDCLGPSLLLGNSRWAYTSRRPALVSRLGGLVGPQMRPPRLPFPYRCLTMPLVFWCGRCLLFSTVLARTRVGGVPPCDIIVGPGNNWVTAAKSIVSGR